MLVNNWQFQIHTMIESIDIYSSEVCVFGSSKLLRSKEHRIMVAEHEMKYLIHKTHWTALDPNTFPSQPPPNPYIV